MAASAEAEVVVTVAGLVGPLWDLPANAALHGRSLDRLLLLNLWIALGLVALAHGVLLAGVLVRRRARSGHLLWVEWLPLVGLTCLFAGLAVQSERLWAAERYVGAAPAALQVEVTGMQFAWSFRYPGADARFGRTVLRLADAGAGNPLGIDPDDEAGRDDVVSSQLVLPVGREVDLTLRAQDVIHGFAVPEMRLKQNAIPGQTVHVHVTPTTTGVYGVLCTQVCGLGHYRMQATLRVLPEDAYERWMAERVTQVREATR